jgi:uncharacterized membrane protein YraQ (UPF0718 family)
MSYYIFIGLFFAGLLHVYITSEMVSKHVGKNNFGSVVKASLLGVPLPLCSCGIIPTVMLLKKGGASKGSIISFLISTPQTGIDSIIATYGIMGPFFAIYRPIAAFFSGILGGSLISKLDNTSIKYNEMQNTSCSEGCCSCNHENKVNTKKSYKLKIREMFSYAYVEFFNDISVNFLIGIIISAVIAVVIPNNFFAGLNINSGLPAMIIMIIIGIPMYICSTSSIPIAITLMLKGFSPGAAFVFLFAGPVTNAASISILSKVLGKKTVSLYIVITSFLAIIFGLILDLFTLNFMGIDSIISNIPSELNTYSPIKIIVAVIFSCLLIKSLAEKILNLKRNEHYC